jgi:uncharacterized protein YdeI (YjbR/CyaY-like superfamily)
MSPIDTSRAMPIAGAERFDEWLRAHGDVERELVVAMRKKASGKQTVAFDELLEVAFCHGWVDVQTKGIDAETYAIRFVPRRPGSNWSERNREIVRRLLAEGRVTPAGIAAMPSDLVGGG